MSYRTLALFFRDLILVTLGAGISAQAAEHPVRHIAQSANIMILSSKLANGSTIGEWGLSVLAVVDDRCVLFDTGRKPDTVLCNACALEVEVGCVSDIVLSHFHFDHTRSAIQDTHDLVHK